MKKLERATEINTSKLKAEYYKANPAEELWMNDIYQVNVRRGIDITGTTLGTMCHLSIKRIDQGHLMDWRHMQQIKNQLVGEENEGMEMFPAESRLVDGANQFHLWVFEDKKVRMPWGFNQRLVTEDESIGNVQRPFEDKPADLEECTEKYLDTLKSVDKWRN